MLLNNLGTEASRVLFGSKVGVGRFFTPTKDLKIHDFGREKGPGSTYHIILPLGSMGSTKRGGTGGIAVSYGYDSCWLGMAVYSLLL